MQRLCLPANLWHQFSEVQTKFPNTGEHSNVRSSKPRFPVKRERPAVKTELIGRRDVYAEAFDFVLRANTLGLRRPTLLCRHANSSWST